MLTHIGNFKSFLIKEEMSSLKEQFCIFELILRNRLHI